MTREVTEWKYDHDRLAYEKDGGRSETEGGEVLMGVVVEGLWCLFGTVSGIGGEMGRWASLKPSSEGYGSMTAA